MGILLFHGAFEPTLMQSWVKYELSPRLPHGLSGLPSSEQKAAVKQDCFSKTLLSLSFLQKSSSSLFLLHCLNHKINKNCTQMKF